MQVCYVWSLRSCARKRPASNRGIGFRLFCSCKTCKFAKFDNALRKGRIHNGTRVLCCNTKVKCLQIYWVAFIISSPTCQVPTCLLESYALDSTSQDNWLCDEEPLLPHVWCNTWRGRWPLPWIEPNALLPTTKHSTTALLDLAAYLGNLFQEKRWHNHQRCTP